MCTKVRGGVPQDSDLGPVLNTFQPFSTGSVSTVVKTFYCFLVSLQSKNKKKIHPKDLTLDEFMKAKSIFYIYILVHSLVNYECWYVETVLTLVQIHKTNGDPAELDISRFPFFNVGLLAANID